jgi:exopolyphosphatase/guanosine-5'-triphosphate,3'-diphosphate pyrophosphatase
MGAMPSASRASFPIRCAGMDVGSNAMRLIIAEFKSPTRYKVVERVRVPVRLGKSVFKTNRIDPETLEAAIEAFREFRKTMEAHDVVVHRAVATSATREAKNRAVFLERVRAETGIDLELIQGTEEARLVALGVRSKLSLDRGISMILDVGGGSSEIALVGHGEILVVESHDVGTVRLLERIGHAPHEKSLHLIQAILKSSRFPILDFFKRRKLARLVGTGGNIETIATLNLSAAAKSAGKNGKNGKGGRGSKNGSTKSEERPAARLTVTRLRQALHRLARIHPDERVKRFDLRPDRADVIVPAGAIFEYVASRVRAREVWVPFTGLVDGVLIDVARTAGAEGMKQLEVSQTRNAALALLKKYEADPKHAEHVSELALSLFDQLKSLHKLGKRDRLLLELGALLHEVGNFIGAPGHHRHAYYIISESPILGLSDEELHIVANVARYHRKAMPDNDHECYAELDEKAQDRVRSMAAILRVADALDHDHKQKVLRIKAKAGDSKLRLKIRSRGDVTLDEWALENKGDLFHEEFGLEPVVEDG